MPRKARLVVVEEHTLGVVWPSDATRYTPIIVSVLRGAPCGLLLGLHTTALPPDARTVRSATRDDLDAFRAGLSADVLDRYYEPLAVASQIQGPRL